MKDERVCKLHGCECDSECDGRDCGCTNYTSEDIDEEAVAYNQMMAERDDRNREYIEMRNMYEDGDLEA